MIRKATLVLLVALISLVAAVPALASNTISNVHGPRAATGWTSNGQVFFHADSSSTSCQVRASADGLGWGFWEYVAVGLNSLLMSETEGAHSLRFQFSADTPEYVTASIVLDSTNPGLTARVSPNPCPRSRLPLVRGTISDNASPSVKVWAWAENTRGRMVSYRTPAWKASPGAYSFKLKARNTNSGYFRPGKYKVYVRGQDKAGNWATRSMSLTVR